MTASASSVQKDWQSSHATTIDVTPLRDQPPAPASSALARRSVPGGGLATAKGNFAAFLAPLTKETFKGVVNDVEQKLKVVNQTLSMLELDTQSFEAILKEMLDAITLKTRELLGADRATIFLIDEENTQLWSIVAEGDDGRPLELRIPADKGIAGEVATFKKGLNIPFDFYDDPRSAFAKQQDQKNNYRTYSMLTLPLLSVEGEEPKLVAVVQLINKLKFPNDPDAPLADRIDRVGFLPDDEALFEEFAPSIRLILESSRSFYMATQKQRAASALMDAIQSLSQSSLDLQTTLRQVMGEAKHLMNADRSTLWLVDEDSQELWTRIPVNGEEKELRIPIGVGFAGRVAQTGELLNIPFDLYEHPLAETAKKTDQSTNYRTCSLLCMPVFNSDGVLIGVTQLVNKKKQGDYAEYNPEQWPEAPECWRASFNRADQEFMHAFNIQAGVALQNAKLFATVKQQEQMQRDILRSLSNAVISTDDQGRVIAANESARSLLGLSPQYKLEGVSVPDLIHLKEMDFAKCFVSALGGENEKVRQQYYPDQTLLGTEEHSIHLSINSIADVSDPSDVYGALVVMDDISDEKRLKSTMYRYMTQELAEELLKLDDAKLGGDRKEVSVLFSDIRSYTTLTENLEAEEVVNMLNEYFESMVDAVFKYKGTLDKYIGDAIMAVFGSPLPLEDHAWMALQTAIEMRQRLEIFNAKRDREGKQTISIGIGINSDSVISGNIGSSKRMEFTAIGDGVNLGSRLESASKQYGCDIVISDSTYRPFADRVWARELDFIKVKGKSNPVSVYELVAVREGNLARPVPDQKLAVIEHYEKARKHYLKREFALAMGQFAQALEVDHRDKASSLHLERCQYWLQHSPPEDWDGSWEMKEK